jgi:hypothetical protein
MRREEAERLVAHGRLHRGELREAHLVFFYFDVEVVHLQPLGGERGELGARFRQRQQRRDLGCERGRLRQLSARGRREQLRARRLAEQTEGEQGRNLVVGE